MSAGAHCSSPVWIFIERLASLKLTLLLLFVLGISVAVAYSGWISGTWGLAIPLALLAINLMAAVITRPAFRRQFGLLVFHLCLLAIILLLAAGRMSYLRGHVELAEGEEFTGRLTASEFGPWHPDGLEKLRFSNEGFSIAYAPGLQRGKTRNWVRYTDGKGHQQRIEIGDQTPLVLSAYRFYTTPNKGFAPTFLWYPAGGGDSLLGSVHLPSYPVNAYNQAQEWQLPGTTLKLWTMLQFDEIILDPAKPSEFRLPKQHKLVMRAGEIRREMQEGESLELPEGRLVYLGLRSWMGYQVFYDWTIHWLLGACLLAVGSLGWYFWQKFTAIPWDQKT